MLVAVFATTAVAAASASTEVQPSEPITAVLEHDFYGVGCDSHRFHLSVVSFASIWLMLNFIIFVTSFAIFMKHWCFKAFTSDTVKGY